MTAPSDAPTLFVAVPSGRALITAQTTSFLVGLTRLLSAHNLMGGFGTLAFPDIEEIRNIFLTIWYDRNISSHLLFIDDDMAADPQLVLDMLALNKPLVGALYPKRKVPLEFVGRAKPGECRIINGHMEVEGVGGGVMLIRRDCVEAILDHDPSVVDEVSIVNHAARELFDTQGLTRIIKAFNKMWVQSANGPEEFSEDLSFCRRWSEAAPDQYRTGNGGKGEVWANISYNIHHIGQYEFTGSYWDIVKDNLKPVSAGTSPPLAALPGPAMEAAE